LKQIKISHDKQKLKEFISTKPVLQKILKGMLWTGKENKYNHENGEKINLTR
jgi:hypothetical protein